MPPDEQPAWMLDALASYIDQRFSDDEKLADLRETYLLRLREADQRYMELYEKFTDHHFAQLNENAKRTIEERGHFVSVDTFDPWREEVTRTLAAMGGSTKGSDKMVAWAIAALGIAIGVAGVVIAFIG